MKKHILMGKTLAATGLLIGVIAALFSIRAYNAYKYHVAKEMRFMMDTYVTIYAIGPKKTASRAVSDALDRMQEIDKKFNVLNPESPIYAFNHSGGTLSDPEILSVVRFSLDVARETGGAFDITVAPLLELWGFYGAEYRLPGDDEIKTCLADIGYGYLTLDAEGLKKTRPGVRVDLGGVAKGYAVGQAKDVLEKEGIKSAIIDAGGDVYALGKRRDKFWNVGIKSPRGEDLLGYVEAEDLAVVGSGDYERFFMKDGKRYHHILDPKTGYPAEGLTGVTAMNSDPMIADAWSTAFFVLGPGKGLEIADKMPGMEAVFITTEGKVLCSSELKNTLNVVPKEKEGGK